jgi:hypothetical protein
MVEDGEHVRKSIQYPGTIFITKTFFGRRGRIRRRMRGKKIYFLL